MFTPISIRGMDGLVVCAMGGARRCRGFEPRFVRPSRGPLARSPPPPPSASPSTIGTAGGWVACLVLVVFLMSSPHVICICTSPEDHNSKKKKQGTRHNTPAAVPPVTGTAGRREPHLLLVFPLGDSNCRLRGSSRLHSHCSARPKNCLTRSRHSASQVSWSNHMTSRGRASGPLTHSQVA